MGAGCVEGTAQAARDATEEEAFPMAHVTAMATFLTNAESAVARASPRASATAGGGKWMHAVCVVGTARAALDATA